MYGVEDAAFVERRSDDMLIRIHGHTRESHSTAHPGGDTHITHSSVPGGGLMRVTNECRSLRAVIARRVSSPTFLVLNA